ncbi:MAG: ShlB/FhaC/HecB family hemolysin secretion/activation protein [Planctomycetaceae bacterium]
MKLRSLKSALGAMLEIACLGGVAGLCQLALCPPAEAQDYDRYRPNPPVTLPHLPCLPSLPQAPIEGSTDIIVESLRGVFVVDHECRIQDPIAAFDGIRIDPAAELTVAREDGFKEAIQPYIGQPVSIRMLNEMARNIVLLYRDARQPVVDISMPPGQDITDGIVQIIITESRIGAVRFAGNCWFDTCMLEEQSCLRPGQLIYEPWLEQELVWYNKNPFRDVDVNLVPGAAPGTTDVVYQVREQRPVRAFAGYENSGVRTTSIDRLLFGVHWGNAGGRDQQFSYQYTTDAHLSGVIGVHSFAYEAPIFENRDSWMMYGSWTDIDTTLGGIPNTQATAWQWSGRYRHTLCENECRLDRMYFGFDTKGTNSDLDFGGNTVVDNRVEIVQLTAGLSSWQQYSDGVTRYAFDGFLSPGHLLGRNNTADFKTLRPGAVSTYLYARGWVERLYEIDCRHDLVVRATGQLSTNKLLPIEQLGFGGYNTVRGYDMRTANGDAGYLLNAEYRTKPIISCVHGRESSLTLLTFADAGVPYQYGTVANQVDGKLLASVGVGARYLIDPNCTIRFDYGVPLHDVGPNYHSAGRVHIGAVFAY